MNIEDIGKILIFAGIIILLSGFILFSIGKYSPWKKLPGDIVYKSEKITVFFPLVSMVIISLILTVILNIIFFILRK